MTETQAQQPAQRPTQQPTGQGTRHDSGPTIGAPEEVLFEQAQRIFEQARDDDTVLEVAQRLLLDFTSVVLATRLPVHDSQLSKIPAGGPHLRAFELAARAHFLDYDDIYDRGRVHIGPCTWGALLALPDARSDEFPRRDLLAAYTAAATVFGTLGETAAPWQTPRARHWFLSQALGGIAAAVACCLATRTSSTVAHNAIGLAFMQASGTKEPAAGVGSTSRQIYPAFAAMSGVWGYQLAAAGFEGPGSWASGSAGFGAAYLGDDDFGTRLTASITAASRNLIREIAPKPWPCCRSTHKYLNGLTALLGRDYPARTSTTNTAPEVLLTALNADEWLLEPVAGRTHPATIPDGRYSIPFVLAMGLTRGVGLASWGEDALTDPNVTTRAARIAAAPHRADRAELSTVEHSPVACEQPRPEAWTIQDAITKFHECADYAGHLTTTGRDRILTALQAPPSGSDTPVSDLVAALTPALGVAPA